MQIQMFGHHVEVTDGIREAVNKRFSKIPTHYPSVADLSITLTVERNQQSVEVKTQYEGAAVAVQGADLDMYVAIADAAKKLDATLARRKGAAHPKGHKST